MHTMPRLAACALFLLGLAACVSSSGGGSPPASERVIVAPQGQAVVCSNGLPPPCR
ncbi:MAG: hypothetical protein FWD12_00935 [Alphaproteobacteria bacterium]|nr:hypothetical protein [Alphaproteobacteria bacterium]